MINQLIDSLSNKIQFQLAHQSSANKQPSLSSQIPQQNRKQFIDMSWSKNSKNYPYSFQAQKQQQMRQVQQQIQQQQLNIDVQQEPFFFELKSLTIEESNVKFMQQLFSKVSDLKTYQEAKDSASPLTIEKIININFIDIKDQESRTIYEFFDSFGILWSILEAKDVAPDFNRAKLKGMSHALQPTKINLLKGVDLLTFTKKETFLQVIRYLLTGQLEVQTCRIIDDLGELIRAFMYFGCVRPLREIERIISEYYTSVSQNRQYISPFMTQACQNAMVSPNWVEIFNHYQNKDLEYQNRVKNLFLNFEQLKANVMYNPTNRWIYKKIDQLYNLKNQKEDLDNQTQIDQATIQNILAEKDIIVKENFKLKQQVEILQAYINQLKQINSSLDQEFRQLQVAKNEQEAACQVKIDELAGIVKMQKDIEIANQAVMRELREQIQNKDNKIQQEKKTMQEECKVSMELENAQRRLIEQQNIIFSNKEAIALLEQRVQMQEAQLNHPVQPLIQQIVQQVDIGHSALQLDPLDASIVLIQVKVPCANRITEINLLDIGKPDNNMQLLMVGFTIDVEGGFENGGAKWTFFLMDKISIQHFGELVNIYGIEYENSEKIGACDLIVKNQNNEVDSNDTVILKFKLASSILKQEDQEDD